MKEDSEDNEWMMAATGLPGRPIEGRIIASHTL
jgi:hypothetical protein